MIKHSIQEDLRFIDDLYTDVHKMDLITPLNKEANTCLLNFISTYELLANERDFIEIDHAYKAYEALFKYTMQLMNLVINDQFDIEGRCLAWLL